MNGNEQTVTAGEKMVALMGGTELTVTLQDGGSEVARVVQLPIKLFPALKAALNDEVRQVALYCKVQNQKAESQSPGAAIMWTPATVEWAERLAPSSHEAVIKEGERINKDFFERWDERRKAREALMPKPNTDEVVKMVEALARSNPDLLKSLLPSGLPGSA